jgi:AcrR family transcriptional regulator
MFKTEGREKIMDHSEKDIRENIIEVAQKIFARFGFKKTTMDEIAHAVRKGKSSIYYYFKSKEEIFQAVTEVEATELKKELTNAVNREDSPERKLRAYVITRMQALNRLANLYSAFKDEYLEHYTFIEKLRESYDQYEFEIYKTILQAGIDEEIFQIEDLELTAYVIVIAAKGLEYHWALEKDLPKIEKSIDSLLEVLFNGIVKR